WPAARRPTMALQAKQAVVMQSRRQGGFAIQWPEEGAAVCEAWSEADMLVENGPVQCAAAPARHLVPGRLFARPPHRHGFAPLFNGAARIATMRSEGDHLERERRRRAAATRACM